VAESAEGVRTTPSEVERIEEVREKLGGELEAMRDKYQRALAEAENVRRQCNKRVEESKQYAVQSFCKDLLEVRRLSHQCMGLI
jgi:molecular chaperone GrpE (heat shock protein)